MFIAAAANGILEVHPENDTWIGLAAGRQILSLGHVPLEDTFSFTAGGKIWYNQNWLTHVIQYWLYDRISHDAVIFANWFFGLGIFICVGVAAYARTGSCAGALIAASVTAFGCRNFLSARPATVGLFCLAALWMLICLLQDQGKRRRWAPIIALFPLFLFWGNAHGSFIFGYGVLTLYVLYAIAMRLSRRLTPLSGAQLIAIVVVAILAVGLTIWLGPFGIHNFTHGEKVAGSAVWRDVVEWQPPYSQTSQFPPVTRFWSILAVAIVVVILSIILTPRRPGSNHNPRVRITLYDLALLGISIAMAMWARRFAPIFFIFLPPILLIFIFRVSEKFTGTRPVLLNRIICLATGLIGILFGIGTGLQAYADLVADYEQSPHFGLLERVTVYDIVPQNAYNFVNENKLDLHLLAEWSLAGSVMLHCPSAKVFIDGRAQQVYEEEQYRQYQILFVAPDAPTPLITRILDQSGTDSILLLKNWIHGSHLWSVLEQSTDWVPTLIAPDYRLYLRRDSAALKQLTMKLQTEEAWWPNELSRLIGSGFILSMGPIPEIDNAISSWKAAMSRNLGVGVVCIKPLTNCLIMQDRKEEAAQLLSAYRNRIMSATDIDQNTRLQLEQILSEAESSIDDQ